MFYNLNINMITLINLPEVVLEKVFSFLTYDNIAQNRVVSFNVNLIYRWNICLIRNNRFFVSFSTIRYAQNSMKLAVKC